MLSRFCTVLGRLCAFFPVPELAPRCRKVRGIILSALSVGLLFGGAPVQGATITWDASGGINFDWSTILNWSGDLEPTAADDVFFPTPIPNPGSLANPQLVLLSANEVANSLTFSADYTLGGRNITLGAASSGGSITVDPGAIATITAQVASLNTTGLTKLGSGTLILSGTNVYSGAGTAATALNITEGTLKTSGGSAIGDATLVSLSSSATWDLNNQSETIGNLSGSGGTVAIGTSTLTLNTVGSGTYNFDGVLTGSGTLIKSSATGATSIQSLRGANTFTGDVIVGGTAMYVQGNSGTLAQARSFTVNGTNLGLFYDVASGVVDRVGDSTPILLNNTGGTSGLSLSTAVLATTTEDIGTITLGAGHNVLTVTSTGTTAASVADLYADSLVRMNRATLLVRGQSTIGAASGARALIRFNADQTSVLDGAEVGGGGNAGSLNISIIPWIIGDLSTTGLGNSFVTYTNAATGLRPLATTEYTTDAAFNALTAGAASTNNVRFTTSLVLTGTAKAINSLVVYSSLNLTITGPSNGIEITSGAILATNTGSHTLNGFTEITTGASRDYLVYVTTSTVTFTIDSPLTSPVPFIKSGAGTLKLTAVGNAFTDLYVNQGTIYVENATNFGKLGTGALKFFGGAIRLDADTYTAAKTFEFGTGGGTIDTQANNVTISNFTFSGSGNLTKIGTGTLTFSGAAFFRNTGTVTIGAGGIELGVTSGITNAFGKGGIVFPGNPIATLKLLGNEQIDDGAIISNVSTTTSIQLLLNGFTETIGGLNTPTTNSITVFFDSGAPITSGTLILNVTGTQDLAYGGRFNGTAGTIIKNGTGTQRILGNSTGTGTTYSGRFIINQGLLQVSGTGQLRGVTGATGGYTLNGGELLFDQDQDTNQSRTSTAVPVTLNNTGGTRGLWFRNLNIDALRSTDIGAITIGAGANVIQSEATSTNANAVADLNGDSISRSATNHATLLVRGTNLGTLATDVPRAYIRVTPTAPTAELIGGGATVLGSPNFSIIPWIVGDFALDGPGNTFVTYPNNTTGFRPLTAAEYTTDAAGFDALPAGAASKNNVRFTTSATLVGTATAINSLVIDSATSQTITGPNGSIEITSGAILAAGAGNQRINGFIGITTPIVSGSLRRDYTISVTTPSATLTLDSPLTSVAALVKSGAGTLQLGTIGNFKGVYFNQGTIRIDDFAKLGSVDGDLKFFGGTLRYDGVQPTATRSFDIEIGGGTFYIANDLILNGALTGGASVDGLGVPTFVKRGPGTLHLASSVNTFTGVVEVAEGRVSVDEPGYLFGGVTVDSGSQLYGEGQIIGTVQIATGGSISPGNDAVGVLQIRDLDFSAGSTLNFEFLSSHLASENYPGTEWDLLIMTGGITLEGTVTIKIDDLHDDFDPSLGTSGDPLTWLFATTATGVRDADGLLVDDAELKTLFQVDTSNLSSTLSGGGFYVTTIDNNLYLNYSYSAVPEPSSIALIGIAGLGMQWHRRRHKARTKATSTCLSPTPADDAFPLRGLPRATTHARTGEGSVPPLET